MNRRVPGVIMGSTRKTLPDSEGDMSESEEEAPSSESGAVHTHRHINVDPTV